MSARTTKTQELRLAALKARKVGSEATKPKPGPARRQAPAPKKDDKVPPPTFQQQDAETGSQDGNIADDVIEEEEEEEQALEEPTTLPPPPKPHARVKSSVSRVNQTQTTVAKATPAAHLSALSLVADYKPVPAKPAKVLEFCPSMYRTFAAHSALASLLTPLKAVRKDDPSYNPVFSRLALAYIIVYIIIKARRACNLMTEDERKVLQALDNAYDFKSIQIPGPLVAHLAALGYHIPSDSRFEVACPSLPALTDILNPTATTKSKMLFPDIPLLLYMANLVAEGKTEDLNTSVAASGTGATATPAETNPDHWVGSNFVPVVLAATSTTRYFYGHVNITSENQKLTMFLSAFRNAAFFYPFYVNKQHLKEVHHHLPSPTIPVPEVQSRTSATFVDLLTAYGLKGQKRFLPVIFESLEYEAKFFKGMTSVENIGFESGKQTLCRFTFKNDASVTTYNHGWHPEAYLAEEGHTVSTSMEDVSDGDMALANLTATIMHMDSSDTNHPFAGMSSLSSTAPAAGDFHIFHAQTKRIVRNAPLVAHLFRTHIKVNDMLKLDEVIGV